MKQLFVLLFALSMTCGSVAHGQFTIEGRVPSLPDSTELTLMKADENRRLSEIATAYAVDGQFTFAAPVDGKTQLSILCFSDDFPQMILQVWVEPGAEIKITGDNHLLYSWVVDSPIHEQVESEYYKRPLKPLWEEYQTFYIQEIKLRNRLTRKIPDEEKEILRKEVDRFMRAKDSIDFLLYEQRIPLMAKGEPNEAFLIHLSGLSDMIRNNGEYALFQEQASELYERLTPAQKASPIGEEIRINLTQVEHIRVGDFMADAELPDTDERLHRLSDYRGKYILLDFWASWCGPCVASIPELKEAAGIYKNDLTVIGISSDSKREDWIQATEKHEIPWVNLLAGRQSEIAAKYGVNGIPHQVLISPEGIILGYWIGYDKGHIRAELKKYIPGQPE